VILTSPNLAPSHLTEEHQSILILTYRDHCDHRQVSNATGVGVRALPYQLPVARQALASILL
jgi:hypothetical protein